MEYKVCARCKRKLERTRENFYKRATNKDGFSTICIKCKKKKDQERRKLHEDKNLNNRNWTKEEDEHLLKYAEFDGLRSVAYGLNRSYIATQNRHSKLRKEKEMQE